MNHQLVDTFRMKPLTEDGKFVYRIEGDECNLQIMLWKGNCGVLAEVFLEAYDKKIFLGMHEVARYIR